MGTFRLALMSVVFGVGGSVGTYYACGHQHVSPDEANNLCKQLTERQRYLASIYSDQQFRYSIKLCGGGKRPRWIGLVLNHEIDGNISYSWYHDYEGPINYGIIES